jgi:nitric oxide dioxygenase
MTQQQIKLVEFTWDNVMSNTHEAGVIFYGKLFELNPNLKLLFKEDYRAQARELVALITFVVHKLTSIEEITDDVKSLGLRHRTYNVKPEYYTDVGAALLWTLQQVLGEQWNEEIKNAWQAVYDHLSSIMITASRDQNQVA